MSVCVDLQNLSDIIHLPGFEDQVSLCSDINSRILCYKAFKSVFYCRLVLSIMGF